eukprot:scaffold61962_cov50-Attheya_sp.AAC.8
MAPGGRKLPTCSFQNHPPSRASSSVTRSINPGSRQLTQNKDIITQATIGKYINATHHGCKFGSAV